MLLKHESPEELFLTNSLTMRSQCEKSNSHGSAINLISYMSRGDLSALSDCSLRPLSLLAFAGPVHVTPAATPQGNRPLSLAR